MKKIPVYNPAEKESSDCETVKFVRAGKFVNRTVCNATGRLESAGLFRRLILTVCFPAAVFFSAPGASALPGFSPSVKDVPGEFVYYQDRTFERESYIGFLMYDEKTYSARYYAPSDKKAGKPELNVTIYFTVDPAENHIELTGEKIISSRTPEDSEIINYIHDMLYELSARRIKAGDIPDKAAVHDDFMQFGGSVTVFYDSCVPLFNIRRIESASEKIEFSVVTAGQLRSSEDKTFAEFKGFPKNSTKKKHLFKKRAKQKRRNTRFLTDRKSPLTRCGSSRWKMYGSVRTRRFFRSERFLRFLRLIKALPKMRTAYRRLFCAALCKAQN